MRRHLEEQKIFVIAIPSGPLEQPREPGHNGSGLAWRIHRFLQRGCGFNYQWPADQLYSKVKRRPLEIAEFRSSDVALAVANGSAHAGLVGLDDVLNLPDDSLARVEIRQTFPFGQCDLTTGVPEGKGFTQNTTLEDLAASVAEGEELRIGTSMKYLLLRICRERRLRITPTVIEMDGHVENAVRYFNAHAVVDITSSRGTMRRNGLIPTEPPLMSFSAVLFVSKELDEERQRIFDRVVLPQAIKALKKPENWMSREKDQSIGSSWWGRLVQQVREWQEGVRGSGRIPAAIPSAMLLAILPNLLGLLNPGSQEPQERKP